MRTIVFAGPSIRADKSSAILDALYLPPVSQGDLISAMETYNPSVVGIIDGFFSHSLSVWHKEILYAIDRGVRVLGSSSMGALRAAELDRFGMEGVGWVYRQFACGNLNGDDEVALIHGPEDLGYPKLSEPLVNIRATLISARDEGLISNEICDLVVAETKQLNYQRRLLSAIIDRVRSAGLANSECDNVARVIKERYIDIKELDAIELLTLIARNDGTGKSKTPRRSLNRTGSFKTLYECDRKVQRSSGSVSLGSIARFAALHMADFEEIRSAAINRRLVTLLAEILGIAVGEQEVKEEQIYFRRSRGLESRQNLNEWLSNNNLNDNEFRALLSTLALNRKLQLWWLSNIAMVERGTKDTLDECRLLGRYPDVADATASRNRLIDAAFLWDEVAKLESVGATTLEGVAKSLKGRPLEEWLARLGFLSVEELKYELNADRISEDLRKTT